MSNARLISDYASQRHFESDLEHHQAAVSVQFGQAAITYQHQATLQRQSAARLLNIIAAHQASVPSGSVIEIGCGTGFITQGLIQAFPQRCLEITDLSTGMLNFCQSHLFIPDHQKPLVSFHIQNGEQLQSWTQFYAAIVSGFVIQWFKDPAKTLRDWFNQLQPGGFLFLSFPTCQSFPEWRYICEQQHLPFTANSLPDPDLLLQHFSNTQIRNRVVHQETVKTVDTYSSAAVFFRSLKAIGAGLTQTGTRLSLSQMKRLIQAWDQQTSHQVRVSYTVIFLAIQK